MKVVLLGVIFCITIINAQLLSSQSESGQGFQTLTKTALTAVEWTGGKPICNISKCSKATRESLHMDSYACSSTSRIRGEWNNGSKTFLDPTPKGAKIKKVIVVIYGSFQCDAFGRESIIVVQLQREEVGSSGTPVAGEDGCYCGNCAKNITRFSQLQFDDWPYYNHSGINTVNVIVTQNEVCLSKIEVQLIYEINVVNPNTKLTTTEWILLGCGLFLLIALVAGFLILIKRKQKSDGYDLLKEGRNINYAEIAIGERIGKGNFGEVFKGNWRGVEIAIKKLPAHNINADFLKEFHKEMTLMKSLRHPNVLQFLGSCTIQPDICIVTEFMRRGSLYSILHDQSQVLDWALIRRMMIDAAKGVLYLHQSDPVIVHRDLKSHNLLVDENWKVKVCDFGLSTMVVQASQTMTACGTPSWTAPEVLRNQRYTEKADVYSFGIVLWEIATRDDPYAGMPPFQVIFAVATQNIRPTIPEQVPPYWTELLQDCWNDLPDKRPAFDEILFRLQEFEPADIPYVTMEPTPPQPSNSANCSTDNQNPPV